MFQFGEMWQRSMDALTKALRIMTLDHSYIYEGKAFRAVWKTASLAAAASEASSITTGSSEKLIYLRPPIFTSTANLLEVIIIEGATITGGSSITSINQNRNSAATATAGVKQGVTISVAGGVEVGKYIIGSGGVPLVPSGSVGADNELVLKPNTTYSIEIKNIGTTTATIGYANLLWFEY